MHSRRSRASGQTCTHACTVQSCTGDSAVLQPRCWHQGIGIKGVLWDEPSALSLSLALDQPSDTRMTTVLGTAKALQLGLQEEGNRSVPRAAWCAAEKGSCAEGAEL